MSLVKRPSALESHRLVSRSSILIAFVLGLPWLPASLVASADESASGEANAQQDAAWFQWRGPDVDGTTDEAGWSSDWPADGPEILWSFDSGDPADNRNGSSSISVVGNRVYALGTDTLFCLTADAGELVWSVPVAASHSTPALNEGRVYVYDTQGLLNCLDAVTGEELWAIDVRRDLGAERPGAYGYASSPIVVNDLVLVSARIDGGALIAVDQRTGDIVWQSVQPSHHGYALWSSPVPTTIDERQCIVWLSGPRISGLDPETGEAIWHYDIPPVNNKIGCAAATPVIAGNRVIAQYHPPHARGYTFCLEITDGEAEVTWTAEGLANWYFSCVGLDGCVYGVDQAPRRRQRDIGDLQCYDVETGELLWSVYGFGQTSPRRTRELQPAGTFVIADGKMISWGNELVVAEVTREGHQVLASVQLPFVGYRTMPVLAGGRLFLRSRDGELFCLDLAQVDERSD